jgi:hypothetical protein
MNTVSKLLTDETYRRLREAPPAKNGGLGRAYWDGYDHPGPRPPESAAVRSSRAFAAWRAGRSTRRAEMKAWRQ